MASETETVEAVRKPGVRVIIHDAYILICCRVQTNLSALVSVHSLSSTSLLSVLIFRLDALALSVIATATWLGGWLSHSGIVSKPLNLSENFFDHLKAPSF